MLTDAGLPVVAHVVESQLRAILADSAGVASGTDGKVNSESYAKEAPVGTYTSRMHTQWMLSVY